MTNFDQLCLKWPPESPMMTTFNNKSPVIYAIQTLLQVVFKHVKWIPRRAFHLNVDHQSHTNYTGMQPLFLNVDL